MSCYHVHTVPGRHAIKYIAGLVCLSSTWAAKADFIDDAKGTLTIQNMYMERDYRGDRDTARAWAQSFILDLKSGYTEGTVGLGVDVMAMQAYKLSGGRGETGTGLVQVDNDGHQSSFGRTAVTLKARYRENELRVGEWSLSIPVMRSNGGRAIPQTVQGSMLTSKEIENTTLYIGRITRNSPRDEGGMHRMAINGTNPSTSKAHSSQFDFLGGEYSFNDSRTTFGAWYARLKDIYKQRYFELKHVQPVDERTSLSARLGYFDGEDEGQSRAGHLDNKAFFGLFTLKTGFHQFTLGLQRLTGQTKFLRVNGMSGSTLANGNPFTSSFDNPQEKSWQLRYDYDFTEFGYPGLTLMTRYLHGYNVHTSTTTNGQEWARETEIAYVVQSGMAKNLSMRFRNSTIRKDYGTSSSWNDQRIIVAYPLSLF